MKRLVCVFIASVFLLSACSREANLLEPSPQPAGAHVSIIETETVTGGKETPASTSASVAKAEPNTVFRYPDPMPSSMDYPVPEEDLLIPLDYVREHMTVLDMDYSSEEAIEAIDAIFDQYDIFLTGENHAVKANFQIQEYFIHYFYEKHGVRYFVLEDAYCSAELMNEYLRTGDETIIDLIISGLQSSAPSAASNEYVTFYHNLYHFNVGLPENEKIMILGVDIQHQKKAGDVYIKRLLPEADAPLEIKDSIDRLKGRDGYSGALLYDIMNDMKQNERYYAEYLGDRFFYFRLGIESILQSYECYRDDKKFNLLRECAYVNNFMALWEHYGRPKVYGNIGGSHADSYDITGRFYHDFTFASYLQHDFPGTKDRVFNIKILYDNCFTIYSGKEQAVHTSPLVTAQEVSADPSKFVFVDVSAEDSPVWIEEADRSYYNYGFMGYIVVYDSPASTPYQQ